MVKRLFIYSGILLILFSIASATSSCAFAMESQSYVTPAGAIGVSSVSRPKNVPNPFKPRHGEGTTIIYNLSADTGTKLIIYDITGQAVWQKSFDPGVEGGKTGQNNVFWDGKSDFGEYAGNGLYIYFITSGSKILCNGHMAVVD